MINLKFRSEEKEILDEPDIDFEEIKINMQELNIINKKLGGHKINIDGLKEIIGSNRNEITICEIGCGGGDNLHYIERWCTKNNIKVSFIAIDIKAECIKYGKETYPKLKAEWIISDYSKVNFVNKPDVIFSSLFCHHFSNDEIISMIEWMQVNSKKGFFINDLQRNIFAYYSIKFLTSIFSKSRLVKNDAPISVLRGFKKADWQKIIKNFSTKFDIRYKWAFRYLIIFKR
ncbi:MAG: methyltransferase domain-containing protein [Ferruginibacter sp.]